MINLKRLANMTYNKKIFISFKLKFLIILTYLTDSNNNITFKFTILRYIYALK